MNQNAEWTFMMGFAPVSVSKITTQYQRKDFLKTCKTICFEVINSIEEPCYTGQRKKLSGLTGCKGKTVPKDGNSKSILWRFCLRRAHITGPHNAPRYGERRNRHMRTRRTNRMRLPSTMSDDETRSPSSPFHRAVR